MRPRLNAPGFSREKTDVLLSRVRQGEEVKHAVRGLDITVSMVACWRIHKPDFRGGYDAARAEGRTFRARPKFARFLDALRGGATVLEACRAAPVAEETMRAWLRDVPGFRREYEIAGKEGRAKRAERRGRPIDRMACGRPRA